MNKIITKSRLKYYLVGIFILSFLSLNRLLAVDSIGLSSTSILENEPSGTTVATITASGASGSVVYTFCGTGTDNNSFSLSGSTLSSSGVFDFETQSSYDICVTATDDSGSLDTPFTINVTDVNEAPTDIALSGSSVDENLASGSTVGTLSSTDTDTGETFTYTLVAGTGSDDNLSFTISGSTLLSNAIFDFETKSSYTVRVRSTDSGSLFTEKQFSITINDLNSAPSDLALSGSTIDENLVIGTTIGTLSGTDDGENHGTLTYSFATTCASGGVDNSNFSINGTTLKSNAVFDFEAQSSYNVCVRVSDGDLFFDKQFPITINNISVEPSDIVLIGNTIDENLSIGTTIGTLTGTNDGTSTGTLVFSLTCATGGIDDASFSITGTTLKSNAVFDFETKSSYNICIRVSDGITNFDKHFPITINNVSEGLINISLSPSTINENLPIGTTIGTLTGTNDSTSTGTLVYSLTCATGGVNDASFSITGTTLKSNAVFDFETKSSYNICVRVSDGVTLFDKNFVIGINDVSEGGGGGGSSGGGGGGGAGLNRDNCPDGDFSPSYYDNECGVKSTVASGSTITIIKDINGTSVDYSLVDNLNTCNITKSIKNPNFIYQTSGFTDINSSSAKGLINKFHELNIINGTSLTTFEPYRNITRAEFTKMILLSHCYTYNNEDISNLMFRDVNKFSWQAKVIVKAKSLGLINGDVDNNGNPIFRPNDYVSNAEALKILIKISNLQVQNPVEISYTDVNKFSWQAKYVQIGETLGILDSSKTGYKFNGDSYIDRENVVILINSVVSLY
ncbi:MAG: S-layer homology domain-containing protein [Candidatus Gracilibacteria bacterium]